jgi:hypothetical protein
MTILVLSMLTFSFQVKQYLWLNIYFKLFIILYADDTVTLSESECDLQAELDVFHEYCLTWKLKVNTSLIKIISARNQDIIMVYEAVIKVDIYGVVLANTRVQL